MSDSNKILDRKWSDAEVRRIYEKLSLDSRMGTKPRFEVEVDGLKVIPRTDDLDRFYSFMGFVDPSVTETVEIKLFKGRGWTCDIHRLHLEPETTPLPEPLAMPPQSELKMELALERQNRKHEREVMERDMELRDLKRDHNALRTEHAELLEYANSLEEEVKEHRQKNLNVGPFHLGELGSVMLESFIKRNPAMLGGIGKGASQTLAGPSDDELDFEEQPSLPAEWMEAVHTALSLSESQAGKILRVLETLSVEPNRIDTIIEHL